MDSRSHRLKNNQYPDIISHANEVAGTASHKIKGMHFNSSTISLLSHRTAYEWTMIEWLTIIDWMCKSNSDRVRVLI